MAVTTAGSGSSWIRGAGLYAGFCASPYPSSLAHGVLREQRRLGNTARLRRPQGWMQLGQTLSAAEPPPAAAAVATLSPPTASATDYSSRINHPRRRRRQHPRLHGVAAERSASSTSPPHPPPPPPSPEAFSGRRGAEWAGWECRFCGADGRPVAVPEDYVPESLREWDVWGFETLTSEQLRKGEEQGDKDGGGSCTDLLYRKRGRVFPETGCALDNLSLEVNALTSPLEGDDVFVASFPVDGSSSSSPGGHIVAKQQAAGSPSLQLEVGLLVPGVQFTDPSMSASTPALQDGEKSAAAAAAAASDGGQECSRARVEVRVDGGGGGGGENGGQGTGGTVATLGPIVTVTRERRYRDDFDDGLLYKGGGLDSQKLRGLLRSKCFAECEESPTTDDLAGNWVSGPGHWQLFRTHAAGGSAPRACTPTDGGGVPFDRETAGIKTLLLPGGITVRSGPWLGAAAVDGTSSAPEKKWGAAGAALAGETAGFPTEEAEPWAVEVGWFVVEGGEGGASAAISREKREVLTTVVDVKTMTPLGAWRGDERRG
ncbi:unnamed protein product [Ectocarpus sp. 12 AP-2014]